MNESQLTSTQVAILFGTVCLATAIVVGLSLRKLQNLNKKAFHGIVTEDHPFNIQ